MARVANVPGQLLDSTRLEPASTLNEYFKMKESKLCCHSQPVSKTREQKRMKMNDDLLGGLIPYIQLDSAKKGTNAASTGCYFCALQVRKSLSYWLHSMWWRASRDGHWTAQTISHDFEMHGSLHLLNQAYFGSRPSRGPCDNQHGYNRLGFASEASIDRLASQALRLVPLFLTIIAQICTDGLGR